eukprot:SAG11_NODE_27451_length_332_cov_1.300429_1_plen_38_part_10
MHFPSLEPIAQYVKRYLAGTTLDVKSTSNLVIIAACNA